MRTSVIGSLIRQVILSFLLIPAFVLAQEWTTVIDETCATNEYQSCLNTKPGPLYSYETNKPNQCKPGYNYSDANKNCTLNNIVAYCDWFAHKRSNCFRRVPDEKQWEKLQAKLVCDFTKATGQAFSAGEAKAKALPDIKCQ